MAFPRQEPERNPGGVSEIQDTRVQYGNTTALLAERENPENSQQATD
jgi:hypothetical protein